MSKRGRYQNAIVVSTPAKSSQKTKWQSNYRSRSSFYRPVSQVGSGYGRAYSTGFPKMLRMKHKYISTCRLSYGSDPLDSSYWYWSCNGMYGPEGNFTGHQPYYFDQLTPIYDHYTVVGSKIKLTISRVSDPQDGAELDTIRVGTCIADSATQITYPVVVERPSGSVTVLNSPDGANNQKVVVMKWSARKAFGSAAISDPNLQGTAAANPSEQQWFYVQLGDNGSGRDVVSVTAEVEYIAVWQELKSVAIS